ncbi:MAG: riboflavin synthase [Candidatus Gracilibacteria bacterium]|nr:riboflavin synthase [Candidatus Gracilibacteria bacterium]
MFSGIIQAKSKILSIQSGTFTVENSFGDTLEVGESIAHDGTCMTIIDFNKESYTFFVMQESFEITNFGEKKPGDFFNVEKSLKLNDAVNGHFVTGHVDTLGTIMKIIQNSDNSIEIFTKFPKKYTNYIIDKGSITINGVSLTVCETGEDYLSVSIIPHTQEVTNLGELKTGDSVNLEFDMVGKYINKIYGK